MTVLNYRPSTSAVYYTPPTRFDFRRTAFGLLIAATLAALGAIGYAEIQPNLQSPYLRVGGVAVASGATALLALIPTRYGRVRIRMLAAFLGATLGLFTLYVMWLVWVHDVLLKWGVPVSYWRMLLHP